MSRRSAIAEQVALAREITDCALRFVDQPPIAAARHGDVLVVEIRVGPGQVGQRRHGALAVSGSAEADRVVGSGGAHVASAASCAPAAMPTSAT